MRINGKVYYYLYQYHFFSIAFQQVSVSVYNFKMKVKFMLEDTASVAGVELNCDKEGPIELFLQALILRLKQKYNKPVVVIIDEYDKPILDLINKPEEMEAVRESLQTFYSVLKSEEAKLRLVFITELYNLRDISLKLSAGTSVGYTESEIKEYFGDHIQAFKSKLNVTDDDVLMNELRQRYNRYRFGLDTANGKISEPIYNPFTIMSFKTCSSATSGLCQDRHQCYPRS